MLRKTSAPEDDSSGRLRSNEEDGEKDSKIKMQRRQQSQWKMALVFLGLIGIVSLVVMVKLRHTQKYAPTLRSRSLNKEKPHELELIDTGGFLPPNSIYKLSVEDVTGKMVSLEKFHGMVTLIVNVACL
jgi:hypothetical protein